MSLDAQSCYRALATHDPRFDGRFFVGVSSTRIYCRPVCSVRTPRPENCRFFKSAAAAEQAGFRPCLRCRPELAPGSSSIDSSERLAQSAIALIEDGVLEEGGLEGLARELGITTRHLRRIFGASFGVSPVAFAQTHRLLLAKRLLTDTRLPVTDIAYAAGFQSVRRFNALFNERYRLAPARLRRHAQAASVTAPLAFELAYRPPYDWVGMRDFLAARVIEGVERVATRRYVRTLRIVRHGMTHPGWISVGPVARRAALRVEIAPSLAKVVPFVLTRVRHAFDLACDPAAVASALGALADDSPGLRVPGTVDGFELAVRAIVGQQISVKGARTLLSRLVRELGSALTEGVSDVNRLFPTPQELIGAGPLRVASIGLVASRARSIVALARAVTDQKLVLEPRGDVPATLRALRNIPGIGAWTAEVIAMRALGWPDAFPSGDGALLRAMGHDSIARASAESVRWQPWRSYAVMHLWRRA